MAEVKILVEGYVSGEDNNCSCCTITLIKDDHINMVVDPGTLKDRQILISALEREGLTIEDINYPLKSAVPFLLSSRCNAR